MDPTQAEWNEEGETTVLTLETIRFSPDGTILFESSGCRYEGKDPSAIVALMEHGQERAKSSS